MVLVTLGGCHLLDGLVVVSIEARKKLVRCSGEELCEEHYARPAGATKSDSSRARCEGQQVVRPGQVLKLVVSTGATFCPGCIPVRHWRYTWALLVAYGTTFRPSGQHSQQVPLMEVM